MEEEEGGERKAWRREAMEEGEADEEKGEMKKVSVLMHSCLLCTDSCTQGHTHKQTDADARVRARAPPPPHPSPWPHWPPLLAAFALGPFLIVDHSRALLSQLSAHLGFKPELLTPP